VSSGSQCARGLPLISRVRSRAAISSGSAKRALSFWHSRRRRAHHAAEQGGAVLGDLDFPSFGVDLSEQQVQCVGRAVKRQRRAIFQLRPDLLGDRALEALIDEGLDALGLHGLHLDFGQAGVATGVQALGVIQRPAGEEQVHTWVLAVHRLDQIPPRPDPFPVVVVAVAGDLVEAVEQEREGALA